MDDRIYGVHAVYEALLAANRPIERILVARESTSGKVREILELARQRGIPVRREARNVLEKLGRGETHQGVIAIAGSVPYASLESLLTRENALIVVLDGVEDPHNLGAIIRTAEAANASGVVVPERHSAPLSAAVVKASAGAAEYLPVARVKNLVASFEAIKARGVWIVGVDPQGATAWTAFDYKVPVALVLGGEHRGLRRLVRENCDVLVHLPMFGRIASLNVSVAAAAVLYEVVRQRSAGQVYRRGFQKGY